MLTSVDVRWSSNAAQGEILEQVALTFSAAHGLNYDESEAVQALLDDQLSAAGLLPPRLFSVPVTLAPGRVVQLHVHLGDDPETVAEKFMHAYAAYLWPTLVQTRRAVADAIKSQLAANMTADAGVIA